MPHDEESGLAMVDGKDFAPPVRQGTFTPNQSNENGPPFLYHRTGTGLASISHKSATGTRPTSVAESLASNATSPLYSLIHQIPDAHMSQPGTRPSSFEGAHYPGTRPGSTETPQPKLDTYATFSSEEPHLSTRFKSLGVTKPQLGPSGTFSQGVDTAIKEVPKGLSDLVEEPEDAKLGLWLIDQFRSDLFDVRREPQTPENTFFRWLRLGNSLNKTREVEKPRLRISIAGLNRMRMRKLQVKLVQQVLYMRYEKKEPKGWEDLLEQYIAAVKDYDYITSCVDRGIDDPFLAITERQIDGGVLRSLLNFIPEEKRKVDGLETVTKETFAPPLETVPQPIGGTRFAKTQKQKTENFISRVILSLVGGVFLVAPMWLMVLHNSKYTALVSTSVFVILAGVVAAWKLDQPIAVLSTTAAYAAVLVVFVGTNQAASSAPQDNPKTG